MSTDTIVCGSTIFGIIKCCERVAIIAENRHVSSQIYKNLDTYVQRGCATNAFLSDFQKLNKYDKNTPRSFR